MTEVALHLKDLHAWYGDSHVLHGVDLEVRTGEVVSLLGRNGAGRSTTLKAVLGLTDRRQGSVRLLGQEAVRLAPYEIARLGVGYCPEERGIFATLSTRENLMLLPALGPAGRALDVEQLYAMFPNLLKRADSPGGRLSGGEQQMLAIARILRTGARFLLLDEISEGLAPVIVQALAQLIVRLKSQGYTILMVEQNYRFAAPLSDRFYVMEHGRIVSTFSRDELAERQPQLQQLLGV